MEIQMTSFRHQQQWVTLNKLRKQGKFCDVIFLMNKNDEYDHLDDSIITAHSCVLSASSPIFLNKLSTCSSSCRTISTKMLVSLENVATDVWELVLDYIYCRKASISKSMSKDTVKAFVNILAKLKLVSEADFRSICEYCTVELDIDDVDKVDADLDLVVQKYPAENEIEMNSSEVQEQSDNDEHDTSHNNFEIVVNSDVNTSFENDESLANKSFESYNSLVEGDIINTAIDKVLPDPITSDDVNSTTDVANTSLESVESNVNKSNVEPLTVVEHIGEDLSVQSVRHEIPETVENDNVHHTSTDKDESVSLDLSNVTYKQIVYCPLDMKESGVITGIVAKNTPTVIKPYANAVTVKSFLQKTRQQMSRKYHCETCGKEFLVGEHLSKHIKAGCNPYKFSYLNEARKKPKQRGKNYTLQLTNNACLTPDRNINWRPKAATASEGNDQAERPVLNEVLQVKQEPLSDSEEQSNTSSNYMSSTGFLETRSDLSKTVKNDKDGDPDFKPWISEKKRRKRKGKPVKAVIMPGLESTKEVKEYVGLKPVKPRGRPYNKISGSEILDGISIFTDSHDRETHDFTSIKIKQEREDNPEKKKSKYEIISDDDEELNFLSDQDDSRDSDFLPDFEVEKEVSRAEDDDVKPLPIPGESPRKRGRPKGSKNIPPHLKKEKTKRIKKAKEDKPRKTKALKLLKDSIAKSNNAQRPVYKRLKNDNVCNLCGKTFPDGSRLQIQTHQREECTVALSPDFKDRPKYLCPFCSKQLSCNYKLTFHIKICHLGERPYPCQKCDATFKDRNSHRDHMMERHNDGCIVCKYCGMEFCNLEKYKKHRALTHADEIMIRSREGNGSQREPKIYVCDICSHVSMNESKLKRHILFHKDIDEWEFSCEVCDKHFVQKSDLKKHMMIHTGEKPFLCEHCSYATNRGSNLKLHMRKHIADRSEVSDGGVTEYKCTECDQIFRLKTELKDHLRLHDTRMQKQNRNSKRRSTRQKSKNKPNYDDSKDDILDEIESFEKHIKFEVNELSTEIVDKNNDADNPSTSNSVKEGKNNSSLDDVDNPSTSCNLNEEKNNSSLDDVYNTNTACNLNKEKNNASLNVSLDQEAINSTLDAITTP